jgi:hypothetical protein
VAARQPGPASRPNGSSPISARQTYGRTSNGRHRSRSGASLGFQIVNILGGGLAPMVMVALLAGTGSTVWVSVYAGGVALLALVPLALAARRCPAAV